MQTAASLIGRVLLALIFIWSGLIKITQPAGATGFMTMYQIPMAEVLVYAAGLVELIGGLLLASGFKARWGAILLVLFLIPTTAIFHTELVIPFADENQARMQWVNLMKNLAVIGGLLLAAAFGPGPASVDARTPRRKV